MKAIMQSIQPKWCELIASGKKTIEVRKTRPKIDPPFKVYMYCTKASKKHQTICGCMVLNDDELYRHPREGIKHGDSIELMCEDNYTKDNFLNGKVIGEYICDSLIQIGYNKNGYGLDDSAVNRVIAKSCVGEKELYRYLNGKKPYLYHISDLVIYDKPKYLGQFKHCGVNFNFNPTLTKPPQSWCYVEELT